MDFAEKLAQARAKAAAVSANYAPSRTQVISPELKAAKEQKKAELDALMADTPGKQIAAYVREAVATSDGEANIRKNAAGSPVVTGIPEGQGWAARVIGSMGYDVEGYEQPVAVAAPQPADAMAERPLADLEVASANAASQEVKEVTTDNRKQSNPLLDIASISGVSLQDQFKRAAYGIDWLGKTLGGLFSGEGESEPAPTPQPDPELDHTVDPDPTLIVTPNQEGDDDAHNETNPVLHPEQGDVTTGDLDNDAKSVASGRQSSSLVATPVVTAPITNEIADQNTASSQNSAVNRIQSQATASGQQTITAAGANLSISPVLTVDMSDTYASTATPTVGSGVWPYVLAFGGLLVCAVVANKYLKTKQQEGSV